MLALDGKTYKLDSSICVIADEAKALGIAGIMGGEETGSTDETTNVFVECAWFEPAAIASAGRKLGIVSDARYRFERTVDPESVIPGIELATRLITELCGGTPCETGSRGPCRLARHRHRLPAVGSRSPHRPRGRCRRDRAGPHPPRLRGRRHRRDPQGHGPVLAPGRHHEGRPRRGGDADRRRRQGAGRAAAAAQPCRAAHAHHAAEPPPDRAPGAGGARARRSRQLVVHLRGGGGTFRRRLGRAEARQPDRLGAHRHAPLAAAGPARRSAAQHQSRLLRPQAVRGRAGVPLDHPGRPEHLCLRHPPGRVAALAGQPGQGLGVRRQVRCGGPARRHGARHRQAAARRRAGLVEPSRPRRPHPARAEGDHRLVRRNPSGAQRANTTSPARSRRSSSISTRCPSRAASRRAPSRRSSSAI